MRHSCIVSIIVSNFNSNLDQLCGICSHLRVDISVCRNLIHIFKTISIHTVAFAVTFLLCRISFASSAVTFQFSLQPFCFPRGSCGPPYIRTSKHFFGSPTVSSRVKVFLQQQRVLQSKNFNSLPRVLCTHIHHQYLFQK